MAVFPTARRALARPSRLPWLIVAVALVAGSLTTPAYVLLRDVGSRGEASSFVSQSTSTLTPITRDPAIGPSRSASASPPLLTPAQQELLAARAATDVQLAAEEAAFYVAPAKVEDSNRLIAEVSSVPAVAGPSANAFTGTLELPANGAAEEEAAAAAPVIEAPSANAPLPAPVVAPVSAGPVERWAATGIVIETKDQQLDELSLGNIDAALNALPASVLSSLGNPAFGALHILVNLEGRVLSGDQPYGGPANFFSTNEATNELVLYPQQSTFTIVHELGHAYNLRRIGAGKYASVLLDPEMRSFLAATGWTIISSDDQIRAAVDHMHVSYSYSGTFHWTRLSNDDPLEDFANSFATYFLDPDTLQESSPQRYAWMLATFGP